MTNNTHAQEPQDGKRRDFLTRAITGLSLAVVGFILYPISRYLKQPAASGGNVKQLVAAKLSEMTPGSSKIFQFGDTTAILFMDPDGNLKALDAICTHLSCTVQYMKDDQYILCACHNGKYDLNGNVISGPPPRPLKQYDVTIQGEDIVVSRA